MSWNFETCFLVFLIVTFASQAAAAKTKSMLPMPLILGVLCAAGFYTGLFPKDMMVTANMIAIGTIAFNVLVVHSGTLIDVRLIRQNWKDALTVVLPALCLIPISLLVLQPLFGREIAFLAPGAAVGGGAACAIASRWVLDKNPAVAVFPWMLFMFQGVFCAPIVRFALKKESMRLLAWLRSGALTPPPLREMRPPERLVPISRIAAPYKTPAYYLGAVMAVSVLNKYLLTLLPAGVSINLNVTALLLGVLFRSLGLLERGPLLSSDSYGLLLMGLMGLFANTIANNTLLNLLRLLPAVLGSLLLSTLVLTGSGLIAARIGRFSPWRGILLTMNSMMGFPVNKALIAEASVQAADPQEAGFLAAQLGPALGMGTMLVSNALSILVASVLVSIV